MTPKIFRGGVKQEVIKLPKNLRSVSAYMFEGSASIEQVEFPEELSLIEEGAFMNCTALTEADIPDSILMIEAYAFSGCTELKSVRLPAGDYLIHPAAFEDCPKLKILVSKGSLAEEFCIENELNYGYWDYTGPEAILPPFETLEMGVDEKISVADWRILPEGAQDSVSYSSENTGVVSVNASGMATAKKVGETAIVLTGASGLTARIPVCVRKAPASVSIVDAPEKLGLGELIDFEYALPENTAGGATFSSSDDSILFVDETGFGVAIGVGKATVTVKTYNNKSAKATIEVLPEPTQISIAPAEAVIAVGDTIQLNVALEEGTAGSFRFSADALDIVAVDEITGALTAVSEGEVNVTVRAYNDVYASMRVEVLPAPEALTLKNMTPDENGLYALELSVGDTYQLEVDMGRLTSLSYVYESSAPGVAAIDENGLITAKRTGSAIVEATAYNGASALVKLEIPTISQRYPVKTIMHAMGAIDGEVYSNCKEAFEQNYARGHRFFEADFSYTKDNYIVLWHNWNKNQINSGTKLGTVPTRAQFEQMKIYDKYTSLTLEGLLELMDDYPDAYIFMDTKLTDTDDVKKQYKTIVSTAESMGLKHVLDRMVVMIYNKSMYSTIKGVYPFKQYVYMMYKAYKKQPTKAQVESVASFCEVNAIDYISMWDYWWKEEFMEIANAHGLEVNLHTISSAEDAQKFIEQGVSLITSDYLSPDGD